MRGPNFSAYRQEGLRNLREQNKSWGDLIKSDHDAIAWLVNTPSDPGDMKGNFTKETLPGWLPINKIGVCCRIGEGPWSR